jgi:hypothetical protein
VSEHLQRLGEVIMHGADEIARTFTEHDDDWQLVFFVNRDDQLDVLETPPWMANDDIAKDVMAGVLDVVVRRDKPRALGMISGAWAASIRCKLCGQIETIPAHYGDQPECPFEADEDTIPSLQVRPKDAPDRVEVAIVSVWDGEQSWQWIAVVDRSAGRPPKKGPWLTHGPWPHPDGVETLGRWMDATVPALREVAV